MPARIIAGIWGMESNFGRFTGSRPTVAALATLAWDPRRGPYFRRELFDALAILGADPGPDLTYSLGMIYDWMMAGFCTAPDSLGGALLVALRH